MRPRHKITGELNIVPIQNGLKFTCDFVAGSFLPLQAENRKIRKRTIMTNAILYILVYKEEKNLISLCTIKEFINMIHISTIRNFFINQIIFTFIFIIVYMEIFSIC
jgi:hypothetical protein